MVEIRTASLDRVEQEAALLAWCGLAGVRVEIIRGGRIWVFRRGRTTARWADDAKLYRAPTMHKSAVVRTIDEVLMQLKATFPGARACR